MSAAAEECFDSSQSTLQNQLDDCIKHLQQLRVTVVGEASVPQATRDLLAGLVKLASQPNDTSLSPPHVACQSSAAGSAASEGPPSTRRPSYAEKLRGLSPPPATSGSGFEMGKFGSCEGLREYPSGKIENFQAGLLQRIGMPHLEYFKAMEMEHCRETGNSIQFTTRNYGICTFARQEWEIVVRGCSPPPEHMSHGRILRDIGEMMRRESVAKAKLRDVEVISLVLYTGPMYVVYNAILTRFPDTVFDNGQCIWTTLSGACGSTKNLFPTTLNVLVSAVQKLSTVTVYTDNLKLYRGTGGDVHLPSHFFKRDAQGCKGMTDWGFFSATRNMNVARNYSGAPKGKPNPVVFEIQTNCVDRGASVSEFSQYPDEEEFIFVPCSFIEQHEEDRRDDSEAGSVRVVPVRIHTNLKAETLDDFERKKKGLHISAFKFRIDELRNDLRQMASDSSRAKEEGLKDDSLDKFIESIIDKVKSVLEQHERKAKHEFSNDVVFRRMVSESLQAVTMATSAMQLWIKNRSLDVSEVQGFSLLVAHRKLQWMLKHVMWMAPTGSQLKKDAAFDICRTRDLCACLERDAINDLDPATGETPLISLCANGGNVDDVELLVAAGAALDRKSSSGKTAADIASEHGHDRIVQTLRYLESNATSAGSQPKHIVCCVTNRTPHVDKHEIFGFGVYYKRNSPKTPLKELCSPAEIICAGAFDGGRRVKSTQNVAVDFMLPLWVSEGHWARAKPKLFEECRKMWSMNADNKLPCAASDAIVALRVICRILTCMVAEEKAGSVLSAAKGETSDCFISGYFSVLRLVKQLASEHYEIVEYANATWLQFVASRDFRLKSSCPNIGDLWPLLCVTTRTSSQNIDWNFVKMAYVNESSLRNVQWYLKDSPSLRQERNVSAAERVQLTFNATHVSRRLACFQRRLMDMGREPNLLGKDSNGHDQDLTKLVDGAVPTTLMVRVKEIYREVERVDSWSKWYSDLQLEDMAIESMNEERMADMLIQSMRESFLLAGYFYQKKQHGGTVDRTLSSEPSVSSCFSPREEDTAPVRRWSSADSGEIEIGKVFVRQLPADCSAAVLKSSFSQFGHLKFVSSIFSNKGGSLCAFVQFCDAADASKVTGRLGIVLLDGTTVYPTPARKK